MPPKHEDGTLDAVEEPRSTNQTLTEKEAKSGAALASHAVLRSKNWDSSSKKDTPKTSKETEKHLLPTY